MNAGKTERTHRVTTHFAKETGESRRDALRNALVRLRNDLDDYRMPLTDRAVAEAELATLENAAAASQPDETVLRHGLLLMASAIGSVRVLAPALAELRCAVERFGVPEQAR